MTPTKQPRYGVAMVVQNDSETILASLKSFYAHVDVIFVSTDSCQGWTGKSISPDDTLAKIVAFDTERKVTVIQSSFALTADAMVNDTRQRQFTMDALLARHPGVEWMLHIDADEVFLDFPAVLASLERMGRSVVSVTWNWIPIFKKIAGEKLLVVTNRDGRPILEKFPFANRPGIQLKAARDPLLPRHHPFKRQANGCPGRADVAALHFTFAKSEARIVEKLSTWSHAREFDTSPFLNQWRHADERWADLRDFHPLSPETWPALRPFTEAELRNLASA